jgi:hypothetical protein
MKILILITYVLLSLSATWANTQTSTVFFMEESTKGCDWYLAAAPKYTPQKINSTQFCNSEILFAQKEPSIIYLNGQSLEKIQISKKIIRTKLSDLPNPPAELQNKLINKSATTKSVDKEMEDTEIEKISSSYVVTVDANESFTFALQDSTTQSPAVMSSSSSFVHFNDKLAQALCCESTKKLKIDDSELDEIMKSMATDPAFEELENEG